MKPVQFHPAAEAEMVAAAVYYEQQLADLGKRFLICAQEAVSKIRINPQLYPIIDTDVRRCLTRTFPFAVVYRERPDHIVVVAVMHLHRDPDYWKNR